MTTCSSHSIELTPALKNGIDSWLQKFPAEKKASAVLAALMLAQEQEGHLTQPLMDAIADYLDMPKIAVVEVATFYSMYNLKPVGKFRIDLCTNISCMLRGVDEIVSHVKSRLGVDFGETTADGIFTLRHVECLGACGGAPAMQIGHTYYEHLTTEKIDDILTALRESVA